MLLFDVYPLYDIEPVRAEGAYLFDKQGNRYLDCYGGHAVISIGHTHPHYIYRLEDQLHRIGFYSNAVQNSIQSELADRLGKLSGYEDYYLFLINSGAEAIENALKLASFYNKRKKIVAFKKSFHGRTSAAVAITDNPAIRTEVNPSDHVVYIPFNDIDALEAVVSTGDVCAVIAESIQGVGGVYVTSPDFWKAARNLCDRYNTLLIADEIQSGYGRSGKFFAHQYAGIRPDLITIAKGMGNGFPIGGLLIHPRFQAVHGALGTTFGGNHLACAAALAVLEVIEKERLIENAAQVGQYLQHALQKIDQISEIRGLGLMIGLELTLPAGPVRKELLEKHKIFTGASSTHIIRLLPPLNFTYEQADSLIFALGKVLGTKE